MERSRDVSGDIKCDNSEKGVLGGGGGTLRTLKIRYNTDQVYTNNSGALFVCNVPSAGYMSAARKTACVSSMSIFTVSHILIHP